jgi:hypothetical protein
LIVLEPFERNISLAGLAEAQSKSFARRARSSKSSKTLQAILGFPDVLGVEYHDYRYAQRVVLCGDLGHGNTVRIHLDKYRQYRIYPPCVAATSNRPQGLARYVVLAMI